MVSYTNPVYPNYFADPFVLRTSCGYVAYGTGLRAGNRIFEALTSPDLVHWTSAGGVLEALPEEFGTTYWAPEVVHTAGAYWMYYCVGHGEQDHQLRVATSDNALGPFLDVGVDLTPGERFAIDAHPFCDNDGTWYLFYARDVLDHARPGTHLAVDRFVSMTELAGEPRVVLEPNADWQILARNREIYGGHYDWHALVGPNLLRHNGRYILLYSGGDWRTPGYKVSWAQADHPSGPWRHAPLDAEPLLSTVPGKLIGPGHNSTTTLPDGRIVIAYHAWDDQHTARRLCIDILDWTLTGQPIVHGPSWTPSEL